MLTTLPLVLFIVMIELSIGSFAVLFALDWRNEVKRGFLISYGLIYLALTGLTYLFQQNFSTPELLNSFGVLDKAWTGQLALPLLLFFLLMIPYNLFLWLDRKAGVFDKDPSEVPHTFSPFRLLRLISGGFVTLAGLATLFVLGMIYRPLAPEGFAQVLTVLGFFAAALAIGGVMTAMWLGHWYLVTPALSERPLQFTTTLVLIGILIQAILAFTTGINPASATTPAHHTTITAPAPTAAPGKSPNVKPANAPVVTPLSSTAIGWIRVLVSLVIPLVLGGLAWKLIRDRSFQSATGMLYLVVVCTLAGEAMARGLFLMGLS
jgi:DMSO reductase anchor subunit